MRHEPGGHVVPLVGLVHGGGGCVRFCPMAEGDIRHGARSLLEVAGLQSKLPSHADRQGEPLPCGDPVDPQVQVFGRRLFRVGPGAVGVAFRGRVVYMPPPPRWGGPRWLVVRLASGVGDGLYMRSAPLGAVPGRCVRGLVRPPACSHVPVIRGSGVFSVVWRDTVRGVPPVWSSCGSGWPRRAAGVGSVWGALLQDSMKASKESSSRVCPPGDVPLSAAGLGMSGVVARALDSACAGGGPRVGASPDAASPGAPASLRCAGAVDGAVPA